MGANSKIEWTNHTFNPWVGCTKVSPACDGCYAESWAKRTGHPELWQGDRRRTTAANWREPLKWNKAAAAAGERHRVFCASLADVFDNQVSEVWRADLWTLIENTPNLDWLLLTKRPQNIRNMLPGNYDDYLIGRHTPWGHGWRNVWLGTTVENQQEADRRIPHLLSIDAAVHFLSCEPLLGPLDILRWMHDDECPATVGEDYCTCAPPREHHIRWVIAGGETGGGARPMHPEWARSLRDQCQAAGVAFHFKQWGDWHPDALLYTDTEKRCPPPNMKVGKHKTGRMLDGRTWDELPEAA